MWLSKPIYESLPYIYLVMGACALGLSMYLNYTIGFVIGFVCLVAGLVVLLKRRDHRADRRRGGQRQDL